MSAQTPALTPPFFAAGGAVGRTDGGAGGAKGTGVGTPCMTWRFISTVPNGRGGTVRGPCGGAGAGHGGGGGAHDSMGPGGLSDGETITDGGVEAVATITDGGVLLRAAGGGSVACRASGIDHPEVGSSSTAMVRVRTRVTAPGLGLTMGPDGVDARGGGGDEGVTCGVGHASMRRSSDSGAWCAPKGASWGSDTEDSSPPP